MKRVVYFYIDAVFQSIRLGLAMDIDSPVQVVQLIGGIVISTISLLFAYFLSSKKFQYYSLIYKVSHIILYMYNMQKLYDKQMEYKQIKANETLYFFIFGQVIIKPILFNAFKESNKI